MIMDSILLGDANHIVVILTNKHSFTLSLDNINSISDELITFPYVIINSVSDELITFPYVIINSASDDFITFPYVVVTT